MVKNSSIIICGIVRDAEYGLANNIPVIKDLCKLFNNYQVIIYENNSLDHTKEILQDWMNSDEERVHCIIKDYNNAHVSSCHHNKIVNPFFSSERITKMATLRNQYLDYVDKEGWNADYLIVVDLDVAQLYLDGIVNSFNRKEKWDALLAYGYSTSPKLKRRYHDSYALIENERLDVPQTEFSIKENSERYAKLCKDHNLLPVYSGFGGLSIYRFDALKSLRYEVIENNDPRVEVHCEHYGLLKQMHEHGYDKIYINPDMKLKYQKLTFRIIYNSIFRRLNKNLLFC